MLLLRVGSGGWLGQGYRNVPPEHPFNSGTEVLGAPQGDSSPPPPPRLQDGCGSGFRVGISILPTELWAALGRRQEAKGTSLSFQKTLHKCFVSLLCLHGVVSLPIQHGENGTISVVGLLFLVGPARVHMPDMRLQLWARKHVSRLIHQRNILLLSSFRLLLAS